MIKITVEAPTITEQMRKLEQFDAIARSEFVPAMNAALALSEADIRSVAPVMSGDLRSSVGGQIKFASGEEVRGVMSATATAANGFRYGMALNASKRYHYAGRRKQTKAWFSGVKYRKGKAIRALFAAALERVVKRLAVNGSDGGGE